MMRKFLPFVAAITIAVALGAGCGAGGLTVPRFGNQVAPARSTPRPASVNAIQHIVVVIQENRSFDNLFNGFPGADTVQSGQMHTGAIVQLQPVPLESSWDSGHSHKDFLKAYNAGKMNGFDLEQHLPPSSPSPTTFPYAYVPRSETVPYWTLASQYVLADRMFQSNSGPSFEAHEFLVAGQSAHAMDNPYLNGKSVASWGCDSPAGTTVKIIDSVGNVVGTQFPCFGYASLASELDSRGLSWRMYTPKADYIYNSYDAVSNIRYSADWTADIVASDSQFLTDVANGKLASVTWIVPSYPNSDHSRSRSNTGPQWVASVVNAIGASRFWNTTTVFVLWDDWGGWYDHVVPTQYDATGLGFRVPLIVVSPYAKAGYVSHVDHEFGSILRYIEEKMSLPSLGQVDARADDLSDCFDITQSPRPYAAVPTVLSPAYFKTRPPDPHPVDDDY